VYKRAAETAAERGVIIADTKFEFGLVGDEVVLIDEVLTPDSSRFWPADGFRPGSSQPSFDKQYVRDWLDSTGWDHSPPPPDLPPDVVTATRARYLEAYERVAGRPFDEWTAEAEGGRGPKIDERLSTA
jgi:phosphoribosylaminoimidazole-succinocarboxamide synthase